jgi:hypothetical protein
MLRINYPYPIYPNAAVHSELLEWLETCTGAYHYAEGELEVCSASLA